MLWKFMPIAVVVVLLANSFAIPVNAKESLAQREARIGLRPSYEPCINATGGVTPDMKDCMSAEFVFQDKRLNTAYKKLMGTLRADEKLSLRNEERSWIKHKDAACDAGDEPGQADDVTAYDCVVTETAKRAQELEQRIIK